MKRSLAPLVRAVVLTALVTALTCTATAQLNSNIQDVTLTAHAPESLSIALVGTTVDWASLTPGAAANPGTGTVQVNSTWKLKAGRTAVRMYAYFANAAQALQHQDAVCGAGCMDIPTSAFQLQGGDVAALTAVNTTVAGIGGANAALLFKSTTIDTTNKNSGSTATLSFNLDLSGGSLGQLPADDYIGTLHIMAQATP